MKAPRETSFPVESFDLGATLASGQAFRWMPVNEGWEGVVAARWVRLEGGLGKIHAQSFGDFSDWTWLSEYLQTQVNLREIIQTFPRDSSMDAAVAHCAGLRLLRQDPWECLASFILSSSKQIVQIQQIVGLLCERYGERAQAPEARSPMFAFPAAPRLAQCSEAELRACKMGFRAPYLAGSAAMVARGEVDLAGIAKLDVESARAQLLRLPGVGRKIADCVLLFAYGFPSAFPIDVWIMKGLKQLYFPRKRPNLKRLHKFSQTYFGPHSGYAQQYLFHYLRTKDA